MPWLLENIHSFASTAVIQLPAENGNKRVYHCVVAGAKQSKLQVYIGLQCCEFPYGARLNATIHDSGSLEFNCSASELKDLQSREDTYSLPVLLCG